MHPTNHHRLALFACFFAIPAGPLCACEYPLDHLGNAASMDHDRHHDEQAEVAGPFSAPGSDSIRSAAASMAPVTSWKLNLSGATGHSADPTIDALVSNTPADVQEVWYDSAYAYIRHTDMPSHTVGPFPGNPAYPKNVNRTSRIPLVPQEAATKTATGLGAIGVMVNGALFFNAADARSYNNLNVWHQNANEAEAVSFDAGPGHPAPDPTGTGTLRPGTYHYHQSPAALISQVDPGNTGQRHSPLIGFAFDGFPVYGPFGYANGEDPESGVKRITSGYQLRSDILSTGLRHSLTDGGSTLPSSQWGPNLSAPTNWQAHANWSGGDFNRDGFVDVVDLGLLAGNWQTGAESVPLADALEAYGLPSAAVPEPSMLAGTLTCIGLAASIRRPKR